MALAMRGMKLRFLQRLLMLFPIAFAFASQYCYAFTWHGCSTSCKSKFCSEAPLLRYGKYCGLFYTGCPGEAPCDGLDSCCMFHDHCVGHSDYLNVTCNKNLLDCVAAYQSSGKPQFPGNTCDIDDMEKTIIHAIQAGVWIGKGVGDGPHDFQAGTDGQNQTRNLPLD